MKRVLYSVAVWAAFTAGLASCKKDYLEVSPTDQIGEKEAFSTTKNAMLALNGTHRAMYIQYSDMDQAGESSMMLHRDFLGEDIMIPVNQWFGTTYRYTATRSATGTQTSFGYFFYYKLIANANMIIANIDNAAGPDTEKKAIKGEALTYRAWAHFQLVQLFGSRYDATAKPNNQPGVPLMLTPSSAASKRASVEDVYTQVNKDLDDAITNMAGYERSTLSHFDVSVAKGIKARVALAMQDWANAAKYAVEARAGYTLMDKDALVSGFNSVNNKEWMWGSNVVDDQTIYFYSYFAFVSANFNSTNIRTCPKCINSALYAKITATDIRKTFWDPTGASIPSPGGTKWPYANKKFFVKNASSSVGDVPYMRAAEMYLIEAEADARLNQNGAAADALYTLAVNRDPSYQKSTKTGTALLDEILIQRRIELWGEGFRFTDLKRMNAPLDRTGANHILSVCGLLNIPAGDKLWQWIIPQDEINASKGLIEQNPL